MWIAARGIRGEACDRELAASDLGHDATATEYERAMADALHFFEIGREQQNRKALFQGLLHEVIDFRLGADVDADSRLLEHEKTHLRLHPAGENDLLLIAAAQRGDHRLGIPWLDGEAVEDDARIGNFVATPDGLHDPFSRRDGID